MKEWKYLRFIPLLIIFTIHIFLDVFYLLKDTRPLAWDQSLHLTLSLVYYRLLASGKILDMLGVSGYYPPLYHLSTVPLYIFGISEDISIFINFIYLLILLFSVYGIGTIIFDKKTGIFAAALLSLYPFIVYSQRDYMLDFALISLIALSILFLLKSDNFSNSTYSVLFGVCLAFTVLIKWSGIVFIIPPLLFVVAQSNCRCPYCGKATTSVAQGLQRFCSKSHVEKYKREGKTRGYGLNRYLFLSLTLFLIVSGIWYIPHLGEVYSNVVFFSAAGTSQPGTIENDPPILSLQSIVYYLGAAYSHLFFLFAVLLLIGIFALVKNEENEKKLFFSLSIVIPYLLFTLIRNKDPRYIAPLLLFISLLSSFWIFKQNTKLQIAIVSIFLFFGFFQLSIMTFGVPSPMSGIFPSANHPREENWRVDDALEMISQHLPASLDHQAVVVILSDHPYVNGRTYEYRARLRDEQYQVYNGAYIPFQTFSNALPEIDFIVYKEGGETGSQAYNDIVQKMYETFREKKDNFNNIASFSLPDNSTLFVVKNRNL